MLSSLVSEWTFDNPTKLGEDTWGSNHGTVVGNVEPKEGDDCIFGGCAYFPGLVGNYIKVTSSPSLKNIDEMSLSFWFKSYTTGTSLGPVSKIYGTKPYWSIWLSNARTYVWEIADTTLAYHGRNTSHKFNHDYWYYVAITQEGANYKLYSNSLIVFQGDDIINFAQVKSDSDLLIGALTPTSYAFKGYIDDVRIYNSALSNAQIKQNYIAGLDSMLKSGSLSKDEYNERLQTLANDE